MKTEPAKRLKCCRCGRMINPLLVRYLWVGHGERGACKFGEKGNRLFGRLAAQGSVVFCGPCGDEFREQFVNFQLGRKVMQSLDSFERGVVRDE